MPPARTSQPPAPMTVRHARRQGHYLWIACRPCAAGRELEVSQIPERFDSETIRDLHYAGRFKCAGCGAPATATMVQTRSRLASQTQLERWAQVPSGDNRRSKAF